MTQPASIKTICEFIWQIEKKYALLNWRPSGVPVWQFLRMNLYYRIAQETGVLIEPHPKVEDSVMGKLRRYADALIFKNPFLNFARRDILIFDHNRKVKIDDRYIDIYTQYFIDDLEKSGTSYEVYQQPEFNRYLAAPSAKRKNLDIMNFLFKRYSRLIPLRLNGSDLEKIQAIEAEILSNLGVSINFKEIMDEAARSFKAKKWFFKKLLSIKKPKRVYLVVSYGYGHLVAAAKELGIETVEFQHGTFSDYHLGYNFPGGEKNLSLTPDRLLVWDEFWKKMCTLPLPENAIEVYPFIHLQTQKSRYLESVEKKAQVLVISQGALGDKIASEIYRARDSFKGMNILYKLHPSEYKVWREYADLVKLSQLENVKVIDHNDVPLYHYLAESAFVVGVFSTVVYEALEFDCKIVLLNLPGIEYMKNLIGTGRAEMFDPLAGQFVRTAKENVCRR